MVSQPFQMKGLEQRKKRLSLLANYILTLHFNFLTKAKYAPPDATGYNISRRRLHTPLTPSR